ncbi:nuclear transport factor 2 family protein [Thalassotalea mangrovi]|uniref:Nuclear transport factor 2 family protein n=1 Tax=Thalassotalea mangrovi TaxID=2572245 RepID=A0A4U1B376_9GAMM|nr:nuclear transport factor 2 family protein [Thalassotalea mangrovi]TKB44216.1 nuclear transport factor 2 family protein [Thalassotalea mangrovi]
MQTILTPDIDDIAIKQCLFSFANYADNHQFELLQQLFSEQVVLDYTSTFGGEVQTLSRQDLIKQWADFLPGFELTWHHLSKVRVTIIDDAAAADADIIASHFLGPHFWQLCGQYQFQLQRDSASKGWQITALTLTLESEQGDRQAIIAANKSRQ